MAVKDFQCTTRLDHQSPVQFFRCDFAADISTPKSGALLSGAGSREKFVVAGALAEKLRALGVHGLGMSPRFVDFEPKGV